MRAILEVPDVVVRQSALSHSLGRTTQDSQILGLSRGEQIAYDPERVRRKIMDRATELQTLPFAEAADVWLEQRKLYIRESTALCYKDYLSRLKDFRFEMGDKPVPFPPLKDIHIGHINQYQAKMRKSYHPASVNHDLNTLSQMMREAGLWAPIQEHYRPLPLPELDPPKVMSESEEDKFFEFASKEKNWKLAYAVASITNNTTASGKELRMMQRGDVHLDSDPPFIQVPKNMKTRDRHRMIPLNERGAEMFARLLKCSAEKGSTRPDQYLFPFREKRNFWNPNKPATESWLKAQWKKLVDAALEAKVISFRVKPHNLRHQAITRLLEEGVPIEVVRQIAGHGVDSAVTRHYHHGRLEVMARAMQRINPKTATNGNGRNRGRA